MMQKTIAIVGKSSVNVGHDAYIFSEKLAYELVQSGHTIRHGGYKGGIMEAVSNGASRAITENDLPINRNIGVPEKRFDTDSERTDAKMFLDPSKDICDRLRGVVLESDYIVVAPIGGDGTMLELQLAIQENTLAQYTGVVRPIILCELPNGTKWTDILNVQLKELENGLNSIDDCEWITVVNSVEGVLKAIKN